MVDELRLTGSPRCLMQCIHPKQESYYCESSFFISLEFGFFHGHSLLSLIYLLNFEVSMPAGQGQFRTMIKARFSYCLFFHNNHSLLTLDYKIVFGINHWTNDILLMFFV